MTDLAVTGPGRFAPSPTSDLHLGNLRTAALAWAVARRAGLPFLVRVEDLDQIRVQAAPQVAGRQLDDLASLGLDWDGDVVVQSQRLDLYREALGGLDVYECFCTRRDIAEATLAPHAPHRPYPGTCRELTSAQRRTRRAERPPALRVRAEGVRQQVVDAFAGAVVGEVDDFVVVRNDGTPAYNLAVVVDDLAQGIGHVTRGRDLLDSAPRQAWLAQRLGRHDPILWCHVGLALNPRRRRLAKRDGAITLNALSQHGVGVRKVVELIGHSLGVVGLRTLEQLLDLEPDRWASVLDRAAEDWIVPGDFDPSHSDPSDFDVRRPSGRTAGR